MYELPISQKSAWDGSLIEEFLNKAVIPLRISVNDKEGYPLICSLWYLYDKGKIYCATTAGSKISELLKIDERCAFEVAPNNPPYRGVRGKANVAIDHKLGREVLALLISKYLKNNESNLAQWLLSRVENEVSLILEPIWISSWDYSDRMKDI